jgi:hypothetical protein
MVSGSTLSGNSAHIGGGIENAGTLTVSGSTLSGNSASFEGGGIFNNDFSTVTVSGSTLSANSAGYGGGIYNLAGTVMVSGTTLSSNSATVGGGGIYNDIFHASGGDFTGTVVVSNSSTISGNTAPVGFGADVYNQGVLHLDASSIIGILDGNLPS